MKFKNLLDIEHADLYVLIEAKNHIDLSEKRTLSEDIKILSQSLYMYDNPDNKKTLTKFIDISGMIPNNVMGKNNSLLQYKIILTKEEFDNLT